MFVRFNQPAVIFDRLLSAARSRLNKQMSHSEERSSPIDYSCKRWWMREIPVVIFVRSTWSEVGMMEFPLLEIASQRRCSRLWFTVTFERRGMSRKKNRIVSESPTNREENDYRSPGLRWDTRAHIASLSFQTRQEKKTMYKKKTKILAQSETRRKRTRMQQRELKCREREEEYTRQREREKTKITVKLSCVLFGSISTGCTHHVQVQIDVRI